ncbi:MAG: hypothetical protein OXH75_04725 [Acidobacteria bacterium]|nr:hypothetical protein [Acidobacteriota bacterium]
MKLSLMPSLAILAAGLVLLFLASLFFEPRGSEFECSRTVHPGGGFTLRCEPP